MTRPSLDQLAIRAFESGDEAAILELFPRAFFAARTRQHFDWKYQNNPWGRRAISVAMATDGSLACQYAGFPVPWVDARVRPGPNWFPGWLPGWLQSRLGRLGSRFLGRGPALHPLFALHIGDTMTAPGFRGAGHGRGSLLAATVRHYYDTFCRQRSPADWPGASPDAANTPIAWNYGFITGNHRKFSLRFVGAREIEPVPYRRVTLPVLAAALASQQESSRPDLAGYTSAPLTTTDAELDAFFARVAPAYGVLVRRDQRWLRWRYLDCPDRLHQLWAVRRHGALVGWGAFRLGAPAIVWGDALFDPAHPLAVTSLLATATAAATLQAPGSEALVGWFPERPTWFADQLAALHFERTPEPNDISLVHVPFAAGEEAQTLLAGAYYTQGDGDLF